VADRINKLKAKGHARRTQLESVGLAIDLLNSGQPFEADGALVERHRQGYLGNVTLAHIAATRGEWARAFECLDIANESKPPTPKELGLTPQQLAWQIKLNNGPLMALVKSRWNESKGPKRPAEDELPDPLFPVNFVNAAGTYEPGALAPAERAKLPPDALATVQQLVLWFPYDTRLYWLLGELYAAEGDFRSAKKIMDECVDSLSYSNRKVLMQHRHAVSKAAEQAKPPDEDALFADKPAEQPHVAFTMSTVWVYVGVVGAIAALAFVRAMLKRRKGNCGPTG
jgi:hypothetical protein